MHVICGQIFNNKEERYRIRVLIVRNAKYSLDNSHIEIKKTDAYGGMHGNILNLLTNGPA